MSGIIGVQQHSGHAIENLIYGLYGLQHRGQEAIGIGLIDLDFPRNTATTLSSDAFTIIRQKGLTSDLIDSLDLNRLRGSIALGYVKYSIGSEEAINRPMPQYFDQGTFKGLLTVDGTIISPDFSINDLSAVFMEEPEAILAYLDSLDGAFTLIHHDGKKMIGYRDRLGIKPLSLGKTQDGYVLASETSGFDTLGAEWIRDIENGELVVITDEIRSYRTEQLPKRFCLFEFVYTARPDSVLDGTLVHESRMRMGHLLAEECPTEADVVIGAPDSGLIAAQGYALQSGIPYETGLIKNRYIDRTFITADEKARRKDVLLKLNPIKKIITGKDVIIVDDSIVRGLTMERTIELLRTAGAKSVHVRIAAPQVIAACNLAMDLPDYKRLISYNNSVDKLCGRIGADSLYFLSLDGLKSACSNIGFCDNCFTGNYPIERRQHADL